MYEWRSFAGLAAGGEFALCAAIVLGKALYLSRAGAGVWRFAGGLAPALALALALGGLYVAAGRIPRRVVALTCKVLVWLGSLIAAFFTAVSSIGFIETGSIPRLQQFNGLTWDILGPSVLAIASENRYRIIAAVVAALACIALFKVFALKLPWRRIRPYYFASALYVAAAFAIGFVWAYPSGFPRSMHAVGLEFFRSDLNVRLRTGGTRSEKAFFKNYHAALAETVGLAPQYRPILPRLKGKNVILLVLESVRAKDIPLYGGAADMPNVMAAKDHMILLKHLYAQDPRSTKAYPQLDMGKFSLLSWDSYSNNIPWRFPAAGLAYQLDRLGYSTYSDVDADRQYDHNKSFQEHHGYQFIQYRQALNPGSPNADDVRMLQHVEHQMRDAKRPFYMMLWPIQTHHPYGREYWADKAGWLSRHSAGVVYGAKGDHARYLYALNEADDWFGRLLNVLKAEHVYKDTVIIVVGDHGEAFGEHGSGDVFHGDGVYEESTHIIGFIYSPAIDGFHVDKRYIRQLDIPATILQIATGSKYLFNDGHSIFNAYSSDIPIYLFNSWAGVAGIIDHGYKLWRKERPGSQIHFASMSAIAADPAAEMTVPTAQENYQPLLRKLDSWEAAMKARTLRLLVQRDKNQRPLRDVVRVYCDDGKGFRESLKDVAGITGLSATLAIPIDKDCRALRIAPIQSTVIPKGRHLVFNIDWVKIVASDRSWNDADLVIAWSNGLNVINAHMFDISGGSGAFDYTLDTRNHFIESVEMKVDYTWTHKRGAKNQ